MTLKVALKELPKTKRPLGMKFQISLLVDDVEVWTRLTVTPKDAQDALIYNLKNSIVIHLPE